MTLSKINGDLAIPLALSPFLEDWLPGLPAESRDLVRTFAEQGYLILDLDREVLDPLADRIISELQGRYPREDRRIENAWYFQPQVRELATHPLLLAILEQLYGRRPIPFQTINFEAGTQQAAHSDAVHFHCIPRQFMAGAWIALEDTDASNGALFAYPGSHRLPEYDMTSLGLRPSWEDYGEYERRLDRILRSSGLERRELHLEKGQVILWAANLIHGGSAITDPTRTRHSQVTHYFFEGGTYYYPMGSEPIAGKVILREVIDIGTGEMVPHRHNGKPIRLEEQPHVWRYPRPLPDWVAESTGTPVDASSDEDLKLRVHLLQQTVKELRVGFDRACAHNRIKDEQAARVIADNQAKDALIRAREGELAYKIARRLTKTMSGILGRS